MDRFSELASTEELARLARAGSRVAFEGLVLRLERSLLRFLAWQARSTAEAEDLAQESFLRAWQRIESYDPHRPFAPWLFTLARRLALSKARARREQPCLEGRIEPADETDPAALASQREERENLWRVARRVLGAEATSALWLRYAEGLEAKEIARILGRRAVTVRVMLFRARARLAAHLEREQRELPQTPAERAFALGIGHPTGGAR